MNKEKLTIQVEKKSILMIAAACLVLFVLIHYWAAIASVLGALLNGLLPIALGFAMAYLVNICMSFYERHIPGGKTQKSKEYKKLLCLLLAILTILLILILVVLLIVPQFTACIRTLMEKAPEAIDLLLSKPQIAALLSSDLEAELAGFDWESLYEKAMPVLQSGLSGLWEQISSGFSALFTVFLSLVFSLYFLSDKDRLKAQALRLLSFCGKPERVRRAGHIASVFDESFHHYVVGQCTEAVILGVLCVLGMLVLKLPYAQMIGTLVGVCNLIPVVGAFIGAIVGAFMILSVSVEKALIFMIFLVILQQLEGNLIYPRVVGKSVGLPGIWVLAAVSVGGTMLGVVGMLTAVPTCAAIYRLLRERVKARENTLNCAPGSNN